MGSKTNTTNKKGNKINEKQYYVEQRSSPRAHKKNLRVENKINPEKANFDIQFKEKTLDDLKISTVSFPVERLDDERKVIIEDNLEIIKHIFQNSKSDIILCAGWTFANLEPLAILKEMSRNLNSHLFVECYDNEKEYSNYYHITKGLCKVFFKQFFAEGEEADNDVTMNHYITNMEERKFKTDVEGINSGFLCVCGEVFIATGDCVEGPRRNMRFRNDKIKESLLGCSLILNPRHTRMGRSGNHKSFLSEGRVLIQCSNRNTNKNQKISPTLHEVYLNGAQKKLDPLPKMPDYCYREWFIPKSKLPESPQS